MAANSKSQVALLSSRRLCEYAVVVAILSWYFFSAVSAVADKSTTFDELFHLTAGYSYWTLGDFRIQPENGNLPQRWAAIPLLFSDLRFPSLDQKAWQLSSMDEIGDQFLYKLENDADAMLLRGRAMMALFGVALGAILFFWMRSLLGLAPALVTLTLFAFCPTMLANGALVTSDMASGLFFTASMLCIWRVLHQINWKTLLVSSLVLGCLFVAKFSAVLVVPMGLILAAIQLISRQPTIITFRNRTWVIQKRRWRMPIHLLTIAFHAIVVWAVIWAFYNFRYEMFAATKLEANETGGMAIVDQPMIPWSNLVEKPGAVTWVVARMRDAHFLPEAYLYGFAHTWRFSQQRSAFFNGAYSNDGWRTFFPYCMLVKTPLTLFGLIALSLAYCIREWYAAGNSCRARAMSMLGSLYRTAPLWVLWVVYWSFAIRSHLNIGQRHILPTYPAMLALAGGSWLWLSKRPTGNETLGDSPASRLSVIGRIHRWWRSQRWPIPACLVLVSIALFCAESLWRWPNYLAYFNQVVGGPRYGYRHLVDSSLDWGQDLPALKRWLVKEQDNSKDDRIYLSYFGTGNPTYYDINALSLPSFFDRAPQVTTEPLEAGTYCISATMLQNVYSKFPGRWNREYETAYQALASAARDYDVRSPIGRDRLIAEKGAEYWIQLFQQYNHARFARLTSFLRQREPDDEVNNSILVYRVQSSELDRALDGPPVELDDAPLDTTKEIYQPFDIQ